MNLQSQQGATGAFQRIIGNFSEKLASFSLSGCRLSSFRYPCQTIKNPSNYLIV